MESYIIEDLKKSGDWERVCYISAHGLVPHVKKLGNNIKGLEIGVASGWNMNFFLEKISQLDLTGIDPYLPFTDWNDLVHTQDLMSSQYQAALKNISKYQNRSRILRSKSEDIYNMFNDNHFDYIFVDGGHTYDAVLRDCINYYPKLRSGGIFSGHDALLSDVMNAVNDFRAQEKIPGDIWYVKDYVWFWIKG